MPRFEVKIGDEFEVAGFEIEDVDDIDRLADLDERRRKFKRQTHLIYGVLAVFVIAAAVSALLGWMDGTYDELSAVLAVGGPWAALVVQPHFKKD